MHIAGGETEKYGNQYEFDILTYYYAKLLNDEVISVQAESYNKDLEKGMDLLIKYPNSRLCAVQVKSRNGLNDCWTVSKLRTYSIIENACHHILRNRDFMLVSPLSYTMLNDLCEKSVLYSTYKEFEEEIIPKSNRETTGQLVAEIRNYWNTTDDIILFFKHFRIKTIPDDREIIIEKLSGCGHINEAEKAYALLDHYATKYHKLNKPISATEIRNYLVSEGVSFFNIDKQNANQTLYDLQDKFIENLKRKLINHKWIERTEYTTLKKVLSSQKIAIVSGVAGSGKSGILFQLCNELKKSNTVFLPVSFEVNKPTNNLFEYGKELGFSTSPINILKALSPEEQCYLIIDQVDAINWEQTDWNSTFDACCTIVKQCESVNNIKIIFACRSIDAINILKFWESSPPDFEKCNVTLSMFSEKNISEALQKDKYKNLSFSAKKLLKNPQNLKLYLELSKSHDYVPTNSIIHDFIEDKQQELIKNGFSESEVKKLHYFLINQMKESNRTTVSMLLLEEKFSNKLIDAYCSAGVIEKNKGIIKFVHQSILDYEMVRELCYELESGKNISKILMRYNRCPIGNLNIVKQFIETCYDNENYISLLENALFNKKLRMSIKNIALQALKTLPQNEDSFKLYMKVIRAHDYGLKYLYYLVNGNTAFSKYFVKQPELDILLKSPIIANNSLAINILVSANNQNALNLLENYSKNTTAQNLKMIIHSIDDLNSSDVYFELKIKLLKENIEQSYYVDWISIATSNTERLASYLMIFLTSHCIHSNLPEIIKCKEVLVGAIKRNPSKLFTHSLNKINNEFDYELTSDYISQYDYEKQLTAIIFETSLQFINNDEQIMNFVESDKEFFCHRGLLCLLHLEYSKGFSLFIQLIESNFILRKDYINDKHLLEIICEILEKFAPDLNDKQFEILVSQIINYKSPTMLEFAKERFNLHKDGIYYPFFEEEQKRLLEKLPYNRLSDSIKNYLQYLIRKFPNKVYYTWSKDIDQTRSYNVISCIANKWNQFSCKTWHQIMSNPKTGNPKTPVYKIIDSSTIFESTIFEFCSTIVEASRSNPEFFADLALKYDDLLEPFIKSICEGLRQSYENENKLELCSFSKILTVFKKYFYIADKSLLRSFISLIKNTKEFDAWAYDKLKDIAFNLIAVTDNEENLNDTDINIKLKNLSPNDLESEKINSIQSHAISCLACYLFNNNELFEDIQPILEMCLKSDNPVLLFSAMDILRSVWRFNKSYAIEKLIEIYNKDYRCVASISSIKLLSHIISDYPTKVADILQRVVEINNQDFEQVYYQIIFGYCNNKCSYKLVKMLILNKPDLCKNAIEQVLQYSSNEQQRERARKLELSIQIKNDNDKKAFNFITTDLMSNRENHKLIFKEIKLTDFANEPYKNYRFIREVEKLNNVLPARKIIFCYCNKINKENISSLYKIDSLIALLIRLYTEANGQNKILVKKRCLKYIDRLYSKFVIVNEIIV